MSTYSLSGSGIQALSAGTTALHVTITTMPAGLTRGRSNPTNYFDIGMLRFGDGTAYWAPFPIVGGPQWMGIPTGTTSLGYSILNGAVVSVAEVIGGVPPFVSPVSASLKPKRARITSLITVTSTSFVPVDSTNLGYSQFTFTSVNVGDVLQMVLTAQLYATSGSITMFLDAQVLQPDASTVFASGGVTNGAWRFILDTSRRAFSATFSFTATQAGTHQLRPAVRVTASGVVDGSDTPTICLCSNLGA